MGAEMSIFGWKQAGLCMYCGKVNKKHYKKCRKCGMFNF
jgi:ribosomal protein L40E